MPTTETRTHIHTNACTHTHMHENTHARTHTHTHTVIYQGNGTEEKDFRKESVSRKIEKNHPPAVLLVEAFLKLSEMVPQSFLLGPWRFQLLVELMSATQPMEHKNCLLACLTRFVLFNPVAVRNAQKSPPPPPPPPSPFLSCSLQLTTIISPLALLSLSLSLSLWSQIRLKFFWCRLQKTLLCYHQQSLIDWLMIAYIALFSALLSRLTALACGSTWVISFTARFWNIHWSGVLTALAWLVPHETAAVSAQVLCTPYNHAPCTFMQSHIRKVYACLAVTCHLHFRQKWPGSFTCYCGNTGAEQIPK